MTEADGNKIIFNETSEKTSAIGVTSDSREFLVRTLPTFLQRTGIPEDSSKREEIVNAFNKGYSSFLITLRDFLESHYNVTTLPDYSQHKMSESTKIIIEEACSKLGINPSDVEIAAMDYLYFDTLDTSFRWSPIDINRLYGRDNGLISIGSGPRPNLDTDAGYKSLEQQVKESVDEMTEENRKVLFLFDNSLDTGTSAINVLDAFSNTGKTVDGMILLFGLLPKASLLLQPGGKLENMFIYTSQDSTNPDANPIPPSDTNLIAGYMATDSIVGCPAAIVGEEKDGEVIPLIRSTLDTHLPVAFTHTYGLDDNLTTSTAKHIYPDIDDEGIKALKILTLQSNLVLWETIEEIIGRKITWSDIGIASIQLVDPDNPQELSQSVTKTIQRALEGVEKVK